MGNVSKRLGLFAKESMRRPLFFGAKSFDRPPAGRPQRPKSCHDCHASIYGTECTQPFECGVHLRDFRGRWTDYDPIGDLLAHLALAIFKFRLGQLVCPLCEGAWPMSARLPRSGNTRKAIKRDESLYKPFANQIRFPFRRR
jgi:hypothetical protein